MVISFSQVIVWLIIGGLGGIGILAEVEAVVLVLQRVRVLVRQGQRA